MLKIAINEHLKEKKEKQKKQANKDKLIFLKAQLNYAEGRLEDALNEFNRVNSHEACYMSIVCNAKQGNWEDALIKLGEYEQVIGYWKKSEEKEYASERVNRLRRILQEKSEVSRVFIRNQS